MNDSHFQIYYETMHNRPSALPPNIEAIVKILGSEDNAVYFGLVSSVLQYPNLKYEWAMVWIILHWFTILVSGPFQFKEHWLHSSPLLSPKDQSSRGSSTITSGTGRLTFISCSPKQAIRPIILILDQNFAMAIFFGLFLTIQNIIFINPLLGLKLV